MSSNVMFVLFNTSSVGLFHECSSLLKKEKKKIFIFNSHNKTVLIF